MPSCRTAIKFFFGGCSSMLERLATSQQMEVQFLPPAPNSN